MIDMDTTPTLTITGGQRLTNGTNGASSINGSVPSVALIQSQKILARIQFMTLCWTSFLAGWNDSSAGPLLPRMQEAYHVSPS